MENLLELADVHKTFRLGPDQVQVLTGASLQVKPGEFVALVGASGSGKSTLLHIAGALEKCDRGVVLFRGQDLTKLSRSRRHFMRNQSFGFVFQLYHLLPELSVLENVLLPAIIAAPWWMAFVGARPRKTYALELLEQLGMKDRLKHRPAQLSGGERQRVAIARALINDPPLILADEPTGNLDPRTGHTILDVLTGLHRSRRQSMLLVTHDVSIAAQADRVVKLEDGIVKPT
ncbi:MAG TPA: ABC transporter ATP-binding protein [Phycisphaerae bacterium]|nr:ABC transporter ATP-binding protein [Phycisphaerae bacterium]